MSSYIQDIEKIVTNIPYDRRNFEKTEYQITVFIDWLLAKVFSILRSDQVVATDLYKRLVEKKVDGGVLRWYTPPQLICLREKLSKEPPKDKSVQESIRAVFVDAMYYAHREKKNKDLQVVLWDLYTSEHIRCALQILGPQANEERKERVVKHIAELFTQIFGHSDRINWVQKFEILPKNVRADTMLLCSAHDQKHVVDAISKVPDKEKLTMLAFAHELKKWFNPESVISALGKVKTGQRPDIVKHLKSLCDDTTCPYSAEYFIELLAALPTDEREVCVQDIKTFCNEAKKITDISLLKDVPGKQRSQLVQDLILLDRLIGARFCNREISNLFCKIPGKERGTVVHCISYLLGNLDLRNFYSFNSMSFLEALVSISSKSLDDVKEQALAICKRSVMSEEWKLIIHTLVGMPEDDRARFVEEIQLLSNSGWFDVKMISSLCEADASQRIEVAAFTREICSRLNLTGFGKEMVIKALLQIESTRRRDIIEKTVPLCSSLNLNSVAQLLVNTARNSPENP